MRCIYGSCCVLAATHSELENLTFIQARTEAAAHAAEADKRAAAAQGESERLRRERALLKEAVAKAQRDLELESQWRARAEEAAVAADALQRELQDAQV